MISSSSGTQSVDCWIHKLGIDEQGFHSSPRFIGWGIVKEEIQKQGLHGLSWLAVIKCSIRKWQEMPLCIYMLFFDFICMWIRTRSGDDFIVWRRVGRLMLCSHHYIKHWEIEKNCTFNLTIVVDSCGFDLISIIRVTSYYQNFASPAWPCTLSRPGFWLYIGLKHLIFSLCGSNSTWQASKLLLPSRISRQKYC